MASEILFVINKFKNTVARTKSAFVGILAKIIFASGFVRLLNRFVNRYGSECRANKSNGMPSICKRKINNVQILAYHRVNDDNNPFFPAITVKSFEKQMEYLAATHNILHLEEAIDRLVCKDVPDNAIVVTFDDGYKDNYTNAFPVLRRLSIPAIIFLTVQSIGIGRYIWHDILFHAFWETQVEEIEGFGDISQKISLKTAAQKAEATQKIAFFLKTLDNAQKKIFLKQLLDLLKISKENMDKDLMLTWENIGEMGKSDIAFGSHTLSHPIMTKIGEKEAWAEINESRKIIERKTKRKIFAFAYPNGKMEDFNEETKKLLKAAGYKCAVTTMSGNNNHDQCLFELKRYQPWENHISKFALKMAYQKFGA
jgi:peptidoglycan/xylan/chitin deacetylase (PgdA/CDA1 family)